MSEPTTLKRPKPGDDEDDLFRMQEDFLRTRQEPSAKVINLRSKAKIGEARETAVAVNPEPAGRIRSKFAERKALQQRARLSTSRSDGPAINSDLAKSLSEKDTAEIILDPVQNLPPNPSSIILGRIIEKKYTGEKNPSQFTSSSISDNADKGFPDVFLIDRKVSGDAGSLFLQNLSKTSESKNSSISHGENPSSGIPVTKILTEESLRQEINEASLKKLNEMSKEEILEAKSQLENTLSPELIEFLRAKKKKTKTKIAAGAMIVNDATFDCKMETDHAEGIIEKLKFSDEMTGEKASKDNSVKMECDADTTVKITPVSELMETAATKGWMHMDTMEREKLEWMRDVIPEKRDDKSSEQPYNARFDFNGVLLPFRDDNLSVDRGLHHHGEEPERPGYSLQELLQLSRSSSQQQRVTALGTLANIMEKSRGGWYDSALEPPPLVALGEKNILLLLRFALDDTSIAVVSSTLRALREFLYSEADEICLDRLAGLRYRDGNIGEPVLSAPKTDFGDASNLKDHELAQFDTVAAAIRSDIVLRIRYILSEMHPPPIGVTAALEILTRLARQSRTTALNIACTPRLLDIIVHNFIPLSVDRSTHEDETRNAYGVPSVMAVRFCRILVSYAGRPVAERLNNLRIVHSIISYTTVESKTIGMRLSIESLRLWKLLLLENVALDSVGGVRLALLAQLKLLLSNHDLDDSSELTCEHAAALIDVSIHESSLRACIATLLTKWSTQLGKVSSATWSQTKLIAVTLTALDDVSGLKCPWIASSNVFASLRSTSNLLSGRASSIAREPSSLPSLGVLMNDGESLQPTVSLNSAMPFFAIWINAFCDNERIIELVDFMKNDDFARYMRELSSKEWSLVNSWYTRPELFFITGIVRAINRLGSAIDEVTRHAARTIAIRLVSTLPSDASRTVKEILDHVLSDETMTIEKLSKKISVLGLVIDDVRAEKLLNLPKDPSTIYGEYVFSSESWQQPAMPKDWPYLPLVAAYTEHKNNPHDDWNDADKTRIIVQLSLELRMPEIVEELSPSLRFSRLILIYLCDTIYLDADVSILLKETLARLLAANYEKLNFTIELPGLVSFTDLFTSFCECFCANSYGDDGFAMALIVPIGQRHDSHYRKLLWSEHAGALRYIGLTREKLTIPYDEYLYPIEEDSTLIESYITALVRGIVRLIWCPLMYEIALHHSGMYLRGNGKLAVAMRKKIVNLRDEELSRCLLNYEPPITSRAKITGAAHALFFQDANFDQ